MRFTHSILAGVATLAIAAPLYAAEVNDSYETNTRTATHVDVDANATVPKTGVNVGAAALGKNTVRSGNSKTATRARGYDHTTPASDGLPVGGGNNADPGTKGVHDHDGE